MRGKVIAVANMKGGVGKTATIVGLAETLAAGGDEVLVIDLDPQASASMCFAGDALLAKLIEEARTIDAFVEDFILKSRQIRFDDCIRANVSEVSHLSNQLPISLLASSPALRVLERELIYKLTKEKFDLNAIVERLFENDEKRTQENKEII
jgi:chromosome partitioning protein